MPDTSIRETNIQLKDEPVAPSQCMPVRIPLQAPIIIKAPSEAQQRKPAQALLNDVPIQDHHRIWRSPACPCVSIPASTAQIPNRSNNAQLLLGAGAYRSAIPPSCYRRHVNIIPNGRELPASRHHSRNDYLYFHHSHRTGSGDSRSATNRMARLGRQGRARRRGGLYRQLWSGGPRLYG